MVYILVYFGRGPLIVIANINNVSLPVKVFASLGAAQAFATVNSRLKTWQQMENKAAAVEPATAT